MIYYTSLRPLVDDMRRWVHLNSIRNAIVTRSGHCLFDATILFNRPFIASFIHCVFHFTHFLSFLLFWARKWIFVRLASSMCVVVNVWWAKTPFAYDGILRGSLKPYVIRSSTQSSTVRKHFGANHWFWIGNIRNHICWSAVEREQTEMGVIWCVRPHVVADPKMPKAKRDT